MHTQCQGWGATGTSQALILGSCNTSPLQVLVRKVQKLTVARAERFTLECVFGKQKRD